MLTADTYLAITFHLLIKVINDQQKKKPGSLHNFSWLCLSPANINIVAMETEIFSPAARLKKRKREKEKKNGFTRISPPANTWDTLEKRRDTLARILARALRLAALPSATFQQYVYTQKTAKFSGAPPLTPRLRRTFGAPPQTPRLRRVGGTSQLETSAFPPSGNTGKSSFLCRLHDREQISRVYCNTGGISGIGGKADGIGGFKTLLQHWV